MACDKHILHQDRDYILMGTFSQDNNEKKNEKYKIRKKKKRFFIMIILLLESIKFIPMKYTSFKDHHYKSQNAP